MPIRVSALYAAILALLFIVLSVRTLRLRKRLRIAIGDGGNQSMLRAIRVHSNFAEYVPLTLLLIVLVEMTGGSALFVHALGISLVAGRVSHAIGVSQLRETYTFRVVGMTLTFLALTSSAVALLIAYFAGLR